MNRELVQMVLTKILQKVFWKNLQSTFKKESRKAFLATPMFALLLSTLRGTLRSCVAHCIIVPTFSLHRYGGSANDRVMGQISDFCCKRPVNWSYSFFARWKQSTDIRTEKRKKIQAQLLGIKPRASANVHRCSYHWGITLQLPLHWIIHSSTSTNVSASPLGDCHVAVHGQQRPIPWSVAWCTNFNTTN